MRVVAPSTAMATTGHGKFRITYFGYIVPKNMSDAASSMGRHDNQIGGMFFAGSTILC
jgi:hypothetical protein